MYRWEYPYQMMKSSIRQTLYTFYLCTSCEAQDWQVNSENVTIEAGVEGKDSKEGADSDELCHEGGRVLLSWHWSLEA